MENEKKIKVVLLEPGKLARAVEIDASLAGMQKVVGGLIEPFYPFEERVCIVCNEESKINGMRPNRSVKNDDGVMVDFIFGPAFICDCRGENLDSLSDEQIDRYGKMFRYAAVRFFCLGDPCRRGTVLSAEAPLRDGNRQLDVYSRRRTLCGAGLYHLPRYDR